MEETRCKFGNWKEGNVAVEGLRQAWREALI